MKAYKFCTLTRKHFTPKDLHVSRIGHFSVFTEPFAGTFWPEVLHAIQQTSG
jgi:hypothetical protein